MENVSGYIDKLIEAASKLTSKMAEAAPQVWEAVLWTVRLDGIQGIVIGLILLAFAVFVGWCLMPSAKKNGDEPFVWFVMVLAGIPGLFKTFYVWSWAAIFAPEVVIARRIMEEVL